MPDAASEAVFGSASDLKSGHHEKNALMSALLPSTALSQVRGVAVFIAVVSTIFVVPLSIALDLELGEFSFALRIVDTIILMDAILAAFTPVQTSSNEWSFSGREIWRQYSRVWLPLNILTLFPAASFLPQSYSKIAQGVRFCRVPRLVYDRALREKRLNVHHVFARVTNLVLLLIVCNHVTACSYIWLSRTLGYASSPFVLESAPHSETLHAAFHTYMFAFYWAAGTLSGVGSGDSPTVWHEVLFSLLCMVLSFAFTMTTIGELGAMFSSAESPAASYRAHMTAVNAFVRSHRIPADLQRRIEGFYEHMWERQNALQSSSQLLEGLPPTLRRDVTLHLNRPAIEKIPFFTPSVVALPGFCNDVIERLTPEIFCPGSLLCERGELGRCMYLVIDGDVQVELSDGKCFIMGPGSFIGEIALLLPDSRRTATVRSVAYAEVYCMTRDHFLELLDMYPSLRLSTVEFARARLQRDGTEVARAALESIERESREREAHTSDISTAGCACAAPFQDDAFVEQIVDRVAQRVVAELRKQ